MKKLLASQATRSERTLAGKGRPCGLDVIERLRAAIRRRPSEAALAIACAAWILLVYAFLAIAAFVK